MVDRRMLRDLEFTFRAMADEIAEQRRLVAALAGVHARMQTDGYPASHEPERSRSTDTTSSTERAVFTNTSTPVDKIRAEARKILAELQTLHAVELRVTGQPSVADPLDEWRCGNRHCGTVEAVRLKSGRCQRCYDHRRAAGHDWMPVSHPQGQRNDQGEWISDCHHCTRAVSGAAAE
jgi:hypothetical protein